MLAVAAEMAIIVSTYLRRRAVLEILDREFYPQTAETIIQRMRAGNSELWQDPELLRRVRQLTGQTFD